MGKTTDSSTRIALQWAMLGAVYPFWLADAASAGRLLRLQKTITVAQIRRRLSETYGDRELVARATRTVLRSYVDWGVLDGGDTKGTYSAAASIEIEDLRLLSLLAEALLHSSRNSTMPIQELTTHPSLFPFRLGQINPRALADASHRIDVHETGSGEVITLADLSDK